MEIRNSSGRLIYCFEILPPPEVNWMECRMQCADREAKLVSLADLPIVCAADPEVFGTTVEKYWTNDIQNTSALRSVWGNAISTTNGLTLNYCSFLNNYHLDPTIVYPESSLILGSVAGTAYSIDLVNASTQYLSAPDSSSLSQTGDFTIEGGIQLRSFPTVGDERNFFTTRVSYVL